ncbi:AMP-binding protein [Phaeobacter gallaeciensis]|uniref:Acyl-CoA synthetase (AMP-forming)/AMP-acid ligase II n=1 Tax=Phaeobacter gallaeciensis TaxID=60890 RepID=A0AAC9Z877_9RHOB|nr:AMP-binding protein [Phaeobacter gallaeciensis]AHD09777.1 Acyl-CoA synthetase (AMP-forming)/AMP-acid ligase II [Phaeobacter gallaeciensis DSM 26640]ATE93041.1 Acyl-CoA synthetase (AMP-forming)/AMP-acid ligase II [Phaeobacter gallaeciensis]ATE97137.1 Acyl-CoA synthetase (AMP-forming)/AMP-acid ligase II [Phaeobacter gallaeciensis]ATF01706.1 Acyl-CoA synthetase (AMP-forming)/AMP-acid ligase II [Phaeobacter gallaeciensis]ATF06086.1 Acyl-CoA synthetase (AMP-forming)/AMP-acid ligase II [Phaeobact
MFETFMTDLRETLLKGADNPALVTSEQVISFADLAAQVEGILQALTEMPPGLSLIVGHKEPACIAAMIACAFSGRAFAFADRATPMDRMQQIAATAEASHILAYGEEVLPEGLPVLMLKDLPARSPRLEIAPHLSEQDTFYVIFTSGSTGTPKGVPISRGNYMALHRWYAPLLGAVRPEGAHVNHASMAFDMGMFDLWPTLSLGRPVQLLNHVNNIMPRNNIRHLTRDAATTPASWASTPSLLQLMCTDPQFSAETLPDLRFFVVGGEMLPGALVQELQQRFPKARIFNGYGPSEATCATHLYPVSAADTLASGPMKIGACVGENRMQIIGPDGQEVGAGEAGELVLSGPQVITHYLPADHPANAALSQPDGVNTYRTGDLARLDAAGHLVLLGRIDRQVKLLGNRIELNEIERIAEGSIWVRKAVCLPQKDATGRVTGLQLFVEPLEGQLCERQALLAHMGKHLAAQVLPRELHFVSQFPVTTNGKLDTQALLAGGGDRAQPDRSMSPAQHPAATAIKEAVK